MKIAFIHGAGATGECFDYLIECLDDHETVKLGYDCFNGDLDDITGDFLQEVGDEEIALVGHSLGGLLALMMIQRGCRASRVVTLASPFGGCEAAMVMPYLDPQRISFYAAIAPTSHYIWRIRAIPVLTPTLSFVATGGSSFLLPQPNDGVVTVASQMSLLGPRYLPVHLAHSELLFSRDVAVIANNYIFSDQL